MVNFKGSEITPSEETKGLIRHMILNSILQYRKQFKSYGKLVICCDGKKYWRREFFPFYKGDRKRARDKSVVDWDFLFQFMDEIKTDLKENFIYPIINVNRAEADDIIAVLCKWSQENELEQDGLFESEPQKIIIVSEDMDFFQLQKYKNVEQYAPRKRNKIKPTVPLDKFVIEHIVKAGDDAIPNIHSNDNCIAEQIRQTPIRQATLDYFLEHGEAGCRTEQEKRNWKRNKTLIDFEFIPKEVSDQIIKAYIEYENKGSRNKIMSYLIKHRCKQLVGELGEF